MRLRLEIQLITYFLLISTGQVFCCLIHEDGVILLYNLTKNSDIIDDKIMFFILSSFV